MDSIILSAFLVQICRLFEVLSRFIHKKTLLVAMLAVPGCVYMLESVFFLNVEAFGVSDSFGERIHIFLLEMWSLFLRTGSRLACYDHRVYRSTREVWKVRVWLASIHYIESEITSWLRTSKYIILTSDETFS